MTNQLPLHDDEREQQRRMRDLLRLRIAAGGGCLSFADYVGIALYEPGLGYYTGGAHKFGTGGDFTTAPESSVLFGACVANACASVFDALDAGADADAGAGAGDVEIVELGAGSGRLARDVLATLAARDRLPRRYRILEVSASLRERQRATLAALPEAIATRVDWTCVPPRDGWRGVLLANEVLDALPFERVRYEADGRVTELGVGWEGALDDGGPVWRERPAGERLAAEAQRVAADLPRPPLSPYTTDLCRMAAPWIASVTGALRHGVALFIDYGLPRAQYYHPERDGGTLRCHFRQRAHADPFFLPGLQDITAWVDFTRVAEGADAAGLELLGFATQAAFLLDNGIEAMVTDMRHDETTRIRRAAEARLLLMPDGMGESFKAIALGRGVGDAPRGFGLQDLSGSL